MSFSRICGSCVKGPGLHGSVKAPRDTPDLGRWKGEPPPSRSVGEQAQTTGAVIHTDTSHPGKPQAAPHHLAVSLCPLFSLHIRWQQTLIKDLGAWDDTEVLSDLLLSIPLCFPSTFFYLHSSWYLPFTLSSPCLQDSLITANYQLFTEFMIWIT